MYLPHWCYTCNDVKTISCKSNCDTAPMDH